MSEGSDIVIVGGGLSGGLIALALAARRPDLKVTLVEEQEQLGGNHLWSCFESDVAPEHLWLVAPLVSRAWPATRVAFPGHERLIPGSYMSIESERLDAALRAALPNERLVLGASVAALSPTSVTLADGYVIRAGGVIDARGAGDLSALTLGYQKFLGRLYELDQPHGLAAPTIMDATVDQAEGYRFVYVLPFGPRQLFIEDTYYSTTPDLDVPALKARIDAYMSERGWSGQPGNRVETGVLPVCMAGDFDAYWAAGAPGVAKAGMRAGLFHAMTGYSLPDAVRTACMISSLPALDGRSLHDALHAVARRHWRGQSFYRLLARMLFHAAPPTDRYRTIERFYRLDPALIGRFYAGRTSFADKVRVLVGRPPVPISRAIAALGAQDR
jgi:lycopene beta-cyclase